MKRIMTYGLIAIAFALIVERSTAKPSGPAKPLTIDQWVKNGPVTLADGKGKTVYIVEFWATWCPPCRESIPHLTALQKKYKDKGVVVVGVSSEDPADVKPFVKAQGDKMDYAVAVDKEEKTVRDYLEANGINTIPHAFLVDKDGNIAWSGSPLDDGMETALIKLLAPPKKPAPAPAAPRVTL